MYINQNALPLYKIVNNARIIVLIICIVLCVMMDIILIQITNANLVHKTYKIVSIAQIHHFVINVMMVRNLIYAQVIP